MNYKFYVYVSLGHVEYFNDSEQAQECAEFYGVSVKEC